MTKQRLCKEGLARNKWSILIVFWVLVILSLHLQYPTVVRRKTIRLPVQKPNITVKYYDVLLNSYMRSGSTLTGIILGWRNDAFYLYEPLWKVSRWAYWRGNGTICRQDKPSCRQVDPGHSLQDPSFAHNADPRIPGVSLVMAKKILRRIYDCQFNDFDNQVFQKGLTDKLGGPSWAQVGNCMKTKTIPKTCINRYALNNCRNARHKVTKVLRLSVGNLEFFLESRINLKAVHLFRDPRAIINSRITTAWYPSGSPAVILDNAKALCSKMVLDYREGLALMEKYPDRFKFLFYEDLNDDPFGKVKSLYRYLGMSLDPSRYTKVKSLPVFTTKNRKSEREKNTAFWWRKSLSWKLVQQIDHICEDVYNLLGYKRFESEALLRNLSWSSVDFQEQYILQ